MTAKKADAGQAEVQKKVDNAEEKGFIGTKVDPLPNSAHSLESGPDSPPVVPDDKSRVVHPTGEEE